MLAPQALMAAWTNSKKCVKVATGASTGNADMILKVVVAEIWEFIKQEVCGAASVIQHLAKLA